MRRHACASRWRVARGNEAATVAPTVADQIPVPASRDITEPRARLSAADRRASIVSAATSVFATCGYDGAKTLQIAHAAGVSEALVYRHFPSKAVLYRAVLRRVVQEQDATMAALGRLPASAHGLAEIIIRSVRHALGGQEGASTEGMRLVFGSLAGDGGYARLVYRRAKRLVLPQIRAAIDAAVDSGDIETPIAAENVANFIEHVTSMIQITRGPARPIVFYPGDDAALIGDAVRFCARGIGLNPRLVERVLALHCASAATQSGPPEG